MFFFSNNHYFFPNSKNIQTGNDKYTFFISRLFFKIDCYILLKNFNISLFRMDREVVLRKSKAEQ